MVGVSWLNNSKGRVYKIVVVGELRLYGYMFSGPDRTQGVEVIRLNGVY